MHLIISCFFPPDNRTLTAFHRPSLPSKGDTSPQQFVDDEVNQEFEEKLSSDQKEYMLPSERKKEYKDILLDKIKGSNSSEEVLSLYRRYSDVMNAKHLLNTMKILEVLVAEG